MGQFGSAQLRFFRQLCTAAKVDTVVRLCEEALAAGMCPVVGIQSTGEARTAQYVASLTAKAGGDSDDLAFESFVEPAALILSSFIEKHLMEYPGSQLLLERSKKLVLPKNPLDDLIDRLGGPSQVAEMTGRLKRMERAQGGGYKYVSRTEFFGGCSVDDVNILERTAFQQGAKRVAIISDAASAGISLHADKGAANKAQRVQITLELAWSADKTVQQLGRTHRSNQAQPPIYKIVSTNICGEHRFASAVAHRLQQLGALTQGDRRAASASEALASFNLQTKWAHNALTILLGLIQSRYCKDTTYMSLNPPWLEDMMREGLPEGQELPEPGTAGYTARREAFLDRWCDKASALLVSAGLVGSKKGASVHALLNKLLGMRVEMQGQLFGYFSAILDKVVSAAKKSGKYEGNGIIKPGCDIITLSSQKEICHHPNGAAPTCLTTFQMDRGVSFAKAQKLLEEELKSVREQLGEEAVDRCMAGFYYSDSATTRHYALILPRNEKGVREYRDTRSRNKVYFKRAQYFRVVRPTTGVLASDIHFDELREKFVRMRDSRTMERPWTTAYESGLDKRHVPLNLLTGSVLPLLTTISRVAQNYRNAHNNARRLPLVRVETSDTQQRFIGITEEGQQQNSSTFAAAADAEDFDADMSADDEVEEDEGVAEVDELPELRPKKKQQQQQQQRKAGKAAAAAAAAAAEDAEDADQAAADEPAAAAVEPAAAAAAAPAAAAAAAEPTEDALRSKVWEVLPGIAAAAGDALSVKAVRQAVQAATGWCLAAANLRAVVKATCAEFLQQQQQQQEGVSDAAVTKAVRKLLRKGGGPSCSSIKSVRLAAAAALGLADLSGQQRSLVKQLVLAHLEQQVAAEQQQQGEEEVQGEGVQGEQEVHGGAGGEVHGEDEEFNADEEDDEGVAEVDELPEFRPKKQQKKAGRAAAAEDAEPEAIRVGSCC
ncbi:hypothetical protein OEZ86_008551 [Tetradesmus obliquus]|nr:hypothetical protein OEZ86_008551 [Tetradesmus obliquus]